MPRKTSDDCVFCRIVRREVPAEIFFEDECCLGFLDIRPLKPGHALLIPKDHYETIKEMPDQVLGALFHDGKVLAEAVEVAFGADGSFSGYNTTVSQSVPHFHLHVVPRMFKDKLFSGGRWIRKPYKDPDEAARLRARLRDAMDELIAANGDRP